MFETPGVTRDRKEIVCEWSGSQFLLVDTGGVDLADSTPMTQTIAQQARARGRGGRPRPLRRRRAATASRPGTRRSPTSCAAPRKPVVLLANKIDDPRRDEAALEFHSLGLGDPLPVSAVHGHNTGDLLDRIVDELRALGAEGRARGGGGGDPRRHPRAPERRQVVAPQRDRRRGARDRLREAGHDARRDRHDRRSAATRPSSSWTRPACGASAGSGRGSSTTRSCARSRPPSAPTSRSSSSTRARGWSTRTSASRTSRARPGARRSSILSKWDITEIDVEDIRPVLEERLRQRPPAGRRLREIEPRDDPHAGQDRRALRQAHRAHLDARAERLPRRSSARSGRARPSRGRTAG